jgi:hypothetical protein
VSSTRRSAWWIARLSLIWDRGPCRPAARADGLTSRPLAHRGQEPHASSRIGSQVHGRTAFREGVASTDRTCGSSIRRRAGQIAEVRRRSPFNTLRSADLRSNPQSCSARTSGSGCQCAEPMSVRAETGRAAASRSGEADHGRMRAKDLVFGLGDRVSVRLPASTIS